MYWPSVWLLSAFNKVEMSLCNHELSLSAVVISVVFVIVYRQRSCYSL